MDAKIRIHRVQGKIILDVFGFNSTVGCQDTSPTTVKQTKDQLSSDLEFTIQRPAERILYPCPADIQKIDIG